MSKLLITGIPEESTIKLQNSPISTGKLDAVFYETRKMVRDVPE